MNRTCHSPLPVRLPSSCALRPRDGKFMPGVVATRKCRINCNEFVTPYRLSNGRESRAAGEVVDAGHRGFSFLCRGELHRAALGVFFESERQSGQQGVCAKDAKHAIEWMGGSD